MAKLRKNNDRIICILRNPVSNHNIVSTLNLDYIGNCRIMLTNYRSTFEHSNNAYWT